MRIRMISLLAALLVLLGLTPAVCARELPDPEHTGSLTLWVAYDGKALDGGSLTLCRVGDIAIDNGNAGFVPVEALSDGPQLHNPNDRKLARELAELVQKRKLPVLREPIAAGWVTFAPLEPGLYLVTQRDDQATDDFAAIQPFLISLPHWEDDGYVYDITAAPKVPLVPEQPTEPTTPTPPSPNLPQTGQLNWPVPLLTILGLSFFCLGWYLCFSKRRS